MWFLLHFFFVYLHINRHCGSCDMIENASGILALYHIPSWKWYFYWKSPAGAVIVSKSVGHFFESKSENWEHVVLFAHGFLYSCNTRCKSKIKIVKSWQWASVQSLHFTVFRSTTELQVVVLWHLKHGINSLSHWYPTRNIKCKDPLLHATRKPFTDSIDATEPHVFKQLLFLLFFMLWAQNGGTDKLPVTASSLIAFYRMYCIRLVNLNWPYN